MDTLGLQPWRRAWHRSQSLTGAGRVHCNLKPEGLPPEEAAGQGDLAWRPDPHNKKAWSPRKPINVRIVGPQCYPMLRLPPVGDLLTATHPFETLAGNSKLPHSVFSNNFHRWLRRIQSFCVPACVPTPGNSPALSICRLSVI